MAKTLDWTAQWCKLAQKRNKLQREFDRWLEPSAKVKAQLDRVLAQLAEHEKTRPEPKGTYIIGYRGAR